MNNDGWGFLGAGMNDNRLVGVDAQHYRQNLTADELHIPARVVTQQRESGGPMKQYLEQEQMRHDKAMGHHRHHLENHYGRQYDSQHGHDNYKY